MGILDEWENSKDKRIKAMASTVLIMYNTYNENFKKMDNKRILKQLDSNEVPALGQNNVFEQCTDNLIEAWKNDMQDTVKKIYLSELENINENVDDKQLEENLQQILNKFLFSFTLIEYREKKIQIETTITKKEETYLNRDLKMLTSAAVELLNGIDDKVNVNTLNNNQLTIEKFIDDKGNRVLGFTLRKLDEEGTKTVAVTTTSSGIKYVVDKSGKVIGKGTDPFVGNAVEELKDKNLRDKFESVIYLVMKNVVKKQEDCKLALDGDDSPRCKNLREKLESIRDGNVKLKTSDTVEY